MGSPRWLQIGFRAEGVRSHRCLHGLSLNNICSLFCYCFFSFPIAPEFFLSTPKPLDCFCDEQGFEAFGRFTHLALVYFIGKAVRAFRLLGSRIQGLRLRVLLAIRAVP